MLDLLVITDIVPRAETGTQKPADLIQERKTNAINNAEASATSKKNMEIRNIAKSLCEEAYKFANKTYTDQDPNMDQLLTKMADFHIRNGQFFPAIEVLLKSLSLAANKSEKIDERTQMTKMTAISKQLANIQYQADQLRDAAKTSRDSLTLVRKSFKNTDNKETLEALHLLSYYCQKHSEAFKWVLTPDQKEVKANYKQEALVTKQEEIKMAMKLKVSEEDMKKLLDEQRDIQRIN